MKVFTPRWSKNTETPQTPTDKTDKSPFVSFGGGSQEGLGDLQVSEPVLEPREENTKHPQSVTDKTDKTPFVSFGGSLPGVNAKKQGGATPTFQDLFLLAARAGFPEYRVNDPWVFIPEGKEAWHRNLQSMFRTFPHDLPRVLAWLQADANRGGGDTHPKGGN